MCYNYDKHLFCLTAIPCSISRLGTSQLQFLAPFRVWELPNCNSLFHFASGNFPTAIPCSIFISGNFPTAIPCSISHLGTSRLQFLVPFRIWELPDCNSLLHFASGNFFHETFLLHFTPCQIGQSIIHMSGRMSCLPV